MQSMHTSLCLQLMISIPEHLSQSTNLWNTVPHYKRQKTPSLLDPFSFLYLKYLRLIKQNNVKSLISAASQRYTLLLLSSVYYSAGRAVGSLVPYTKSFFLCILHHRNKGPV